MDLTITKEKVLEAASKCETAKATLKVLFPEVFEKNSKVSTHISDLRIPADTALLRIEDNEGKQLLCTGVSYAPDGLRSACFFLDDEYFNWEYRVHNGKKIIIPTKK